MEKSVSVAIVYISIFFAILCLTSCQTLTSRMVENSQQYHYKNNQKTDLTKKPEWITKTPDDENTTTGKIFHFIGKCTTKPSLQNCDNLDFVRNKAVEDARNQVSQYLKSEVKSISKDKVKESKESKSISRNSKDTLVVKQEISDEVYVESYIKSSSSFGGLTRKEEYWEKYETKLGSKPKNFYNVYIHYTINEKDIKKALAEIEKRESINEKEKKLFNEIKTNSGYLIKLLKGINFVESENEFKSYYFELCEMSSSLKGLTYYNTLDLSNDERRNFENIKAAITKALEEYDPTDIQKQYYLSQIRLQGQEIEKKKRDIEFLETEIKELTNNKDSVIKTLNEQVLLLQKQIETTTATLDEYTENISSEIEKLQENGIHLISTNIFAVYPNKPSFNIIGENFLLSDIPVTNKDYVSYLTLSGHPNYSKAELGLDSPVFFVSLYDCVSYCNWLSRLYGLPEYYSIRDGVITKNNNIGYRLPQKSEIDFAISKKFSDLLVNKAFWTNEFVDNETGFICYINNIETKTEKIPLSESNAMITFIIARNSNE